MNAVMVVEDEQLIAKDIADTLTEMGYDVTGTAASAAECVTSAQRRRPDLVLMDIHLKGDTDGIDAARLLRERFDIPVIFSSAYGDDGTLSRAKLSEPLGHLLKPFRKCELKSAVEVGLVYHQLERRLRARERWFSTTLRAIADAVIAVGPTGQISFMNRSAEALLGRHEAAARGQVLGNVAQLLDETTRRPIPDPIELALRSRQVVRLPCQSTLVAAGRELPIGGSVASIVDERDETLGAVLVLEDLTEKRQAQEQVVVADRLASLGAVAAGIAHEINNPLTYISSNVGFVSDALARFRTLLGSSAPAEHIPEVLESLTELVGLIAEVEEGATRVARIVADLGLFGRREKGSRQGDPIAALEWALRVSHSAIAPHGRITRRLSPVPVVRADEGSLGQVFLNLLLNAAYAMQNGDPDKNELFVSAELEARGNRKEGPDYVLVMIRDTGCGMAPEVLARIFDPFFTTKPVGAGTGLGLSVCHGVIHEMGGEISATSVAGKGSTFRVRLPVAEALGAERDGAPRLTQMRARILLIDDDERVLRALARVLRPIHDVTTSQSARGGLAKLHKGSLFDVIVCDLLMPDMSGMEFYVELVNQSPELAARIIFLSGGNNMDLAADFFRLVPNIALQKPPARGELLLAIDRQIKTLGRASSDLVN